MELKSTQSRKEADICIIPFFEAKKGAECALGLSLTKPDIRAPLACGDFSGKSGETRLLYIDSAPEQRLLLLGLGSKTSGSEGIKRAYAKAVQAIHALKLRAINLLLPDGVAPEDIVEGLLLANYAFSYKSKEKETLIDSCAFVGASKSLMGKVWRAQAICEGVITARDLTNKNADEVTSHALVTFAKQLGRKKNCRVTIFDRKRLQKEGFGLLLAVNRGSFHDPFFIRIDYRGKKAPKETTCLIGKGVTFDTGGLNLKPQGGIEGQRFDMAGAATVLSFLDVASRLELPLNLTVLVPSTDNAIGPHSYKPGDVYTGYNGTTVEISNTDAEGRLLLADAIAYACHRVKPARILTFATLTGAVIMALGDKVAGLMSTDDGLGEALLKSGKKSGDLLCRLPLFDHYKEQLKTPHADLKSTGGKFAGALTAATFLTHFVTDIPFAHIDMAGTAAIETAYGYCPRGATGFGVRLLAHFFS